MVGWIGLGVVVALVGWWAWERSHRRRHPVPPGLQTDVEIPWEQEFELYHNALSLCSMKTRVCLAELRIPYRGHPIDLIETGRYETLSRHFLAVNPAGTVPVLVHRGHPIYESHEQIRLRSCPTIRSGRRRWSAGSTRHRSPPIPSRTRTRAWRTPCHGSRSSFSPR
jgi:hypothetical protein